MFRPEGGEGKRELFDRKLICLLAAVGYVVGLGNDWCFSTCHMVGVVSFRRVAGGWPAKRPSEGREFKLAK